MRAQTSGRGTHPADEDAPAARDAPAASPPVQAYRDGDGARDCGHTAVDLAARARLMRALDVGPQELDELVGGDAAALACLDDLVVMLERKLKPGRLRGVVRRPARVLGDRSMLDVIRDGELERVLVAVREGFRWDEPA
jgi:hypothetical protein